MNMQQMMAQAQKMQRELNKALAQLDEKEFTVSKGGAVTISIFGSHKIKLIDIDKNALEPENKEMIEDMLIMAYNELLEKIEIERGDIYERITGRRNQNGL